MVFSQKNNLFIMGTMIILATLFLLTPTIIRSAQGNNALIGEESYVHLGLAQNLNGANFPFPHTSVTLFTLFISSLLIVTKSPLLVGKLLPLVFALFSLLLMQLKIKELFEDEQGKTITSLLFIISPLFIIIFTSLNPYSFILCLGLFSWYMFNKNKWSSMVALVLILGVDIKAFLVVTALLIAQSLLDEKDAWKLPMLIGGIGVVITAIIESLTGYIALDPLLTNAHLGSLLSSFGSDVGYSLFISILAIIGLVGLWKRKRECIFASIIFIGVFIFSFHELSARVLLLPIFAILASKGFSRLFQKEWSVRELKDFTLFVITLALLFTLILTISSRVHDNPDLEMMDALLFLQSAPDGEFILSSTENGALIERIAGQPAFIDDIRKEESFAQERQLVAEEIFSSQRMVKTEQLLEEQNITHILIDDAMRNGGVWTADEQGLLFLVKYSPKLVLVYQNMNIEIYRYVALGVKH